MLPRAKLSLRVCVCVLRASECWKEREKGWEKGASRIKSPAERCASSEASQSRAPSRRPFPIHREHPHTHTHTHTHTHIGVRVEAKQRSALLILCVEGTYIVTSAAVTTVRPDADNYLQSPATLSTAANMCGEYLAYTPLSYITHATYKSAVGFHLYACTTLFRSTALCRLFARITYIYVYLYVRIDTALMREQRVSRARYICLLYVHTRCSEIRAGHRQLLLLFAMRSYVNLQYTM